MEPNLIMKHKGLIMSVCFLTMIVLWTSNLTDGVYVSNLNDQCYRCLCHVVTGCDLSNGCVGGYCGPFNISHVYWVDAGRVTLLEDDPERSKAWIDCALDYNCAKRIIEGYLQKFGKDCNEDGITDCFDFMMINGNGGYRCNTPLNRTANGRKWLKRYEDCRF